MPLSLAIIEARIWCHIARMREDAAWLMAADNPYISNARPVAAWASPRPGVVTPSPSAEPRPARSRVRGAPDQHSSGS
jgi:hypothetical protein